MNSKLLHGALCPQHAPQNLAKEENALGPVIAPSDPMRKETLRRMFLDIVRGYIGQCDVGFWRPTVLGYEMMS